MGTYKVIQQLGISYVSVSGNLAIPSYVPSISYLSSYWVAGAGDSKSARVIILQGASVFFPSIVRVGIPALH